MSARGDARPCPHCRELVLARAAICPGCQRRLRVGGGEPVAAGAALLCPLNVEGLLRPPGPGEGWEYTVRVELQDGQGAVLARRVVRMGPLPPGEGRKIAVHVEVHVPEAAAYPALP